MKKNFGVLLGVLLFFFLFLTACAPAVSDEQVFSQLNSLSEEELDATLSEKPLVGEAQATPYQITPLRRDIVKNVTRNVERAAMTFTSCTDSDGGPNYNQRGEVAQNYTARNINRQRMFTDQCLDYKNLTEYYCVGSSFRKTTQECDFKCVDGVCAKYLEYVPGAPPDENRALDIIAYIDTDTSDWYRTRDPDTGYSLTTEWGFNQTATEPDVRRVLDLAAQLFYEKTGVSLIVRDVRLQSFDGIHPYDYEWVKELLETEAEPPEMVAIFSPRDGAWVNGGYSVFSQPVEEDSPYCNEFELAYPEIGQKGAGIVIIDWDHYYAACGYDHDNPPGRTRISETPASNECYGNQSDICVLRNDGLYYQCESTLSDIYSERDFWTTSVIIHEITHTLDTESYGHFGSVTCPDVPKPSEVGWETFRRAHQENFGICPKTFPLIIDHFKGCSVS